MSEGTKAQLSVVSPLLNGVLDAAYGYDASSLALAAHELKSPLALIRQLALMLETQTLSPHEYERLVEQIRLTSERALRLTGDVTRLARGETLFDIEPLNPVSICEEVAHELAPLFAAHSREIHVVTRTRPALVVGNYDLLRRILLNFGDNALHYAPGDKPVELAVACSSEKVRIGVRDFGSALPHDVWQSLTARLAVQAAQPVSGRPQSSGLGLHIASQFARLMNGNVGAIRHRKGATFYVDMAASHQLSLL